MTDKLLREALAFYGNMRNWQDGGFTRTARNTMTLIMSTAMKDCGERARAALAATPTHRSDPMTDTLRDAVAALQADDAPTEREIGYQDAIDEVLRIIDARAALAAAPQPAVADRQALVEVISDLIHNAADAYIEEHDRHAIANALLARGLRLPGDGSRNRVEYDDAGKLDEVVADAGMHLERMSDQGWFLSGQRSDGSEIAIWLKGKVVAVEERPAIRVVEGGDDAA